MLKYRVSGVVCVLALFAVCALPPTAARAQPCGEQWLPGDRTSTLTGRVAAMRVWDPDGSGPRSPLVIVGGDFNIPEFQGTTNIAAFDPITQQWTSLGSGVNSWVNSLGVMPNGELLAAGAFSVAGGSTSRAIGRWNGTFWSPWALGPDRSIAATTVLPNGHIIAGGDFTLAGGVSAARIARWDGVRWWPLGAGLNGTVLAVALLPNGEIVAGGEFSSSGGIGGVTLNRVARWNGTEWMPMGNGMNGPVLSLLVMPNGDLIAGGNFASAGGRRSNGIARWNGSEWSPLGEGMNSAVRALVAMPDGSLVAGGSFTTAGGQTANRVARWNGSAWAPIGGGMNNTVSSLEVLANGDLMAGGEFSRVEGRVSHLIARWDGSSWSTPTPRGFNSFSDIRVILPLADGSVIVAGSFNQVGGVEANNIARWDAGTWTALGEGSSGRVTAVAALPNGDLIASGRFRVPESANSVTVARWNGSAWSSVGNVTENAPLALSVLPNGHVIAGGTFSSIGGVAARAVARWDGSTWSPLGGSDDQRYGNARVSAIAQLPSGDLLLGGRTLSVPSDLEFGYNVIRWNGQTLEPMGVSAPITFSLLVLPNGEILRGGEGTIVNNMMFSVPLWRWDGTQFAPIQSSGWNPRLFANVMTVLPNGHIFAGGDGGGNGAWNIAVWDGSAYRTLGSDVNGRVFAASVASNGELFIGGQFVATATQPGDFFARYSFTGTPAVGRQPKAAAFGAGETVTLSAAASPGYRNVSVQWKRNGVPIANGAGGASVGGGTVSGAADTLGSPTNGTASTLTIANVQPSDVGDYSAVFTNACGSSETVAAKVRCRADFDNSTFVDVDDFVLFIDQFSRGCTGAGQAANGADAACVTSADVDGSGFIDVDDFVAFVAVFVRGC